jgi:hypothetical protein
MPHVLERLVRPVGRLKTGVPTRALGLSAVLGILVVDRGRAVLVGEVVGVVIALRTCHRGGDFIFKRFNHAALVPL